MPTPPSTDCPSNEDRTRILLLRCRYHRRATRSASFVSAAASAALVAASLFLASDCVASFARSRSCLHTDVIAYVNTGTSTTNYLARTNSMRSSSFVVARRFFPVVRPRAPPLRPSSHRCHSRLRASSSSSSHPSSSSSAAAVAAATMRPPPPPFSPAVVNDDGGRDEEGNYTRYERLVRKLYRTNLFHPVKLGLTNIERLHGALGRPMDDLTVIHVAGTNGKGSVSLKIAKSLELLPNDVRIGLFVSPHVSSFRERMSVNGIPITEEEVCDYLPRIYDLCDRLDIPATFFEITTALAFLFYKERGCDAVVLETGLGGRLDATNVVSNPALAVITSIGLEHTRILGDTIELIALEKGGIMKRGRPVLVGPNVPGEVLRECASRKGAGGYYTADEVLGADDVEENREKGEKSEEPPLVDYDLENARIARAALTLLNEQIERGERGPSLPCPVTDEMMREGTSHRPPCRFEQIAVAPPSTSSSDPNPDPVDVILDIAHNPPAMRHLLHKLESSYPHRPKRIVAGFSSDKDLGECGRLALQAAGGDPNRVRLVEASHPRAATVESVLSACPELADSSLEDDEEEDRSISTRVTSALRRASSNGEVLVVCGSVFLMAEAREALGYDEPRDTKCIEEVAGSNLKASQENFGGGERNGDETSSGGAR